MALDVIMLHENIIGKSSCIQKSLLIKLLQNLSDWTLFLEIEWKEEKRVRDSK